MSNAADRAYAAAHRADSQHDGNKPATIKAAASAARRAAAEARKESDGRSQDAAAMAESAADFALSVLNDLSQ